MLNSMFCLFYCKRWRTRNDRWVNWCHRCWEGTFHSEWPMVINGREIIEVDAKDSPIPFPGSRFFSPDQENKVEQKQPSHHQRSHVYIYRHRYLLVQFHFRYMYRQAKIDAINETICHNGIRGNFPPKWIFHHGRTLHETSMRWLHLNQWHRWGVVIKGA